MENKELNIAAILKGKPKTKVWSDTFGELTLEAIREDKEYPILLLARGDYDIELTNEGYYFPNIDVVTPCIVPSKQMRDWSKFAWKKGDVLSCGVDSLCIFNKWVNDEYTEFNAEFVTPNYRSAVLKTIDWTKVTNEDTIKQYISKIEKVKGGKLSLETLDIEKPRIDCGFKTFDKVLVRDEYNEIWQPAIFISLSESEMYPYFCNNLSSCAAESYKECIDYDGNEDLASTDNAY